jgi:hypothetical protein
MFLRFKTTINILYLRKIFCSKTLAYTENGLFRFILIAKLLRRLFSFKHTTYRLPTINTT